MKVIRYEDPYGKIHHAVEGQQAGPLRVEGDPLHGFQVTGETAIVGKILAPVVPTMIWCIGKNYRRHADEVGMGVDERSEEHTSELQSRGHLVCRLLLEK